MRSVVRLLQLRCEWQACIPKHAGHEPAAGKAFRAAVAPQGRLTCCRAQITLTTGHAMHVLLLDCHLMLSQTDADSRQACFIIVLKWSDMMHASGWLVLSLLVTKDYSRSSGMQASGRLAQAEAAGWAGL